MNKAKLKQLIKEELQAVLESDYDPHQPSGLDSVQTLTAIEEKVKQAGLIKVGQAVGYSYYKYPKSDKTGWKIKSKKINSLAEEFNKYEGTKAEAFADPRNGSLWLWVSLIYKNSTRVFQET